ncbi:unnamed protein product [Chilo suppressalis]|uniref:C-type lectin domain-containing protein n=1 Tax=Chilo suppressalis TaxID=168631 RepID=A0ABN8AT72_CHISP|nr:unnamed protein product [Chilo suppressalis]
MLFASVFFVSVTLCLTYVESSQYRSDYEYSHEASGWLKFHRVPATFTDAFLRCNAEGSTVASPSTVDLRQAMMTIAKTHTDSCGIFTGVHAVFSKGDFATVEGIPLHKLPVTWAPNEPDNYKNNEDCTIMLQNGTLADVRCNDTYPYICYKKKTDDNPLLTPCGTIDIEYVLDTSTGSCYKFHTAGHNWRRAYMTCMAEGGYLAIINSAAEAQIIANIFAKYPSSKITAAHKDIAAIGFYSWGEHGNWYTVQGESLEKAGYSTFANGQPDNHKAYENGSLCGGVYRTGVLDDVWCNSASFPFICEKKPGSLIPDDN